MLYIEHDFPKYLKEDSIFKHFYKIIKFEQLAHRQRVISSYPPVSWPGIFAVTYTGMENVPANLHECEWLPTLKDFWYSRVINEDTREDTREDTHEDTREDTREDKF